MNDQTGIVLEPLNENFSICQIDDTVNIEMDQPFGFVCRTDAEKSLVCPTERVPDRVIKRDDDWKCFRVAGTLDLSLIGVLARMAKILASNEIGLFVISTYHTDYLFTKADVFHKALKLLKDDGYIIKGQDGVRVA